MTTLSNLHKASFRGEEFLYVTGNTTGGRKTVNHEFPQQDFRYVEDLGESLRTFSITGEIAGAFAQTKKQRLVKALATKGIGQLVHPFYGIVDVTPTTYTVVDDASTRMGVFVFTMTFLESKPNVFPKSTGKNNSLINRLYNELYDFVETDLRGEYLVQFAKNIDNMANRIVRLVDVYNGILATIISFTDDKNQFDADLTKLSENAVEAASNADFLADAVITTQTSFDNLAVTPGGRFTANSKLFWFGSEFGGETVFIANTEEIRQRDANRLLFNGAINTLALTSMYSAAISVQYQNDVELNYFADKLEEAYQYLINDKNSSIQDETLNKLITLRDEVRSFFDTLSITISKVINVETKETSVAVLAYKYYGNLDNYNEIIALNRTAMPIRISGDIRIVTG